MKKQTALEWLSEEISGFLYSLPNGNRLEIENAIIKAKEMEEEQIKEAHLLGLIRPMEMEAIKQAEQYYNETYEGEQ